MASASADVGRFLTNAPVSCDEIYDYADDLGDVLTLEANCDIAGVGVRLLGPHTVGVDNDGGSLRPRYS